MEEKRMQAAIAGLLHDVGKLAQPGAYHHRPHTYVGADSALVWAVALAEKLSAGECDDRERNKEEQPPQQLLTIFDSISLQGAEPRRQHYLPLQPMTLEKTHLFPQETAGKEATRGQYEHLLKSLSASFQHLSDDPAAALEQMLSAMQTYTWSVPSAFYYSRPDISLYDHSRMTAALAVCLSEKEESELQAAHEAVAALWQAEGNEDKLPAAQKEMLRKDAVLLLGGDISGIQDFIYTIGAKHAAKTLRGRSFYLQLLTEAVLRFVLNELQLPYTNVIYAGGGHFFLLAPLSVQAQLPGLRRQITEKLLTAHGIKLYLALDGVSVPYGGFRVGAFPQHWGAMHRKLAAAKNQRYTELGEDLNALVFSPKEHGGNAEKTCAVCGVEVLSTQVAMKEPEDSNDDYFLCPLCDSFDKQIGTHLPNSSIVYLGEIEPVDLTPDSEITASSVLASFGISFTLQKNGAKPDLPTAARMIIAWQLDDADSKAAQSLNSTVPVVSYQHYTVTQVPHMEFDDLQKESEGIKRLGVLRMDVDDLGMIFQKGFERAGGDSAATLSRLATLSLQMSLFFEGWLKKIIADEAYKGLIYAVYSGGDDLFLIGPWHLMPALAQHIVASFKEYTGENPDLHLSGGMAFIHGKYPVQSAADDAGELEKEAKAIDGKQAFAFLGGIWQWDAFAQLDARKEDLKTIDKEGGARRLLQLLQQLDDMQTLVISRRINRKPVWGPWMWMGDYHLKRMEDRTKGSVKEKIKHLRESLHDPNSLPYENLHEWAKAARWAQLELRDDVKE